MVISLFFIVFLLFTGLLIVLVAHSSGRPRPFLDSGGKTIPNSISEKSYIELEGGNLGFFIKGLDKNNPVLLYLHGGMPDYFLTEKYPTGLDRLFTVVWLEQRGAGLSYNARVTQKSIIIDDLISDTIKVTNYLRQRFSQNKIYLMAHSGGTFLGIKVIERYPELYEAYIGVSQIVYQKLSEMKAYEYIVMRYGQDAKKRNIYQNLLAHPVALTGPLPAYYTRIRDYAMHDLGVGTMRKMKNVITGLFIPSLLFGEYSLTDKLNLWRGKWRSGISVIWNDISSHDLSTESTSFQLPVHFLHGIYDYTCSYELAKQYHEVITAPHKGFYSLHESAHSPIFEEPEECVRIIKQNVLNVTLPQPSTS